MTTARQARWILRLPGEAAGSDGRNVAPGNLREEEIMRTRGWITLMLAAVLAVACDQQPVEPQVEPAATESNFNFSNGPDAPGNSVVLRWTLDGAWAFIPE